MKKIRDSRINQTIEWLRYQVKEAKAAGLAVGISGGIDSAVAANLIKLAFPEQSLGLVLPINSQSADVTDGIAVAETAGLAYHVIDLTDVHGAMIEKVMDALDPLGSMAENNRRMSDANLRARLRMSTLYAAANALNYLVVGTDNAAELYTGYFTKYGDGGVDLLPIAKLMKREVYDWAQQLGVPEQIIHRPPSAGLWEGQTDEAEMGTTYNMIDRFLAGENIPPEEKRIIEDMHQKTMHKRQMPPLPDW